MIDSAEGYALLLQDVFADNVSFDEFARSARFLQQKINASEIILAAADRYKSDEPMRFSYFVYDVNSASFSHLRQKKFSKTLNSVIATHPFAPSNCQNFPISAQNLPHLDKLRTDLDQLFMNGLFHKNELIGVVFTNTPVNLDTTHNGMTMFGCLSGFLATRQQILDQQAQNSMYQQVLNLIPQRVFWKNRDSIYQGANTAFAKDAGLESEKDLIGKTDYDFFPTEAELYRRDDAKTIKTRTHLINSEEPQTHADGSEIWLRTSKIPRTNSNDEVIGIVGTYDEITELKNVQRELSAAKKDLEQRVKQRTEELTFSNDKLTATLINLNQAQDQLVESAKMSALGSLVAGIAHEINTPIGVALTGSSHLVDLAHRLEKLKDSGELTKSQFDKYLTDFSSGADLIVRNLGNASAQVGRFKLVAVDQSNDLERELNLSEYVNDVIKTLAPIIRNKNIQTQIDIDPSISFLTYPGALAQVLTNLMENSVKYGFSDGRTGEISISATLSKQGHLRLIFADNGSGIDQSIINRIFEPFFTTRLGTGGSGLGLHIVYNIATQLLKGSISCTSEINKGTTFEIAFDV